MMPFYSAFPPPAAAMKMIYGNFGAAALRFRSRVGFGQSRILKASASEQKDRLWESFGFEKAVPVGAKSAKFRSDAPCRPRAPPDAMHAGKIRRAPPKKQKEKRRRNSVFPLTLYVIAVDKSGFGSQPFPRAADPRPQDDPSGGIQLSNDGRQIRGWQSRQLGLTP